jgi:broad specificity phosphatase PhoE
MPPVEPVTTQTRLVSPSSKRVTLLRVTTILIARHGESDWNRERRWQGHADRPLTERGREQARALAARLAHIELDAVYSSDLERARETGAIVADEQRLELRIERDLREVDVGSWAGLTRAEAEARFPEGFAQWRAGFPGWKDGETYEAMTERVLAAVGRIAGAHDGERLLVVSHGGPIRAIHAAALGLDIHAYRRLRPVEPNARLSAVCVVERRLTELCPANEIDDLIARDQRERREAAAQPPTPAG